MLGTAAGRDGTISSDPKKPSIRPFPTRAFLTVSVQTPGVPSTGVHDTTQLQPTQLTSFVSLVALVNMLELTTVDDWIHRAGVLDVGPATESRRQLGGGNLRGAHSKVSSTCSKTF